MPHDPDDFADLVVMTVKTALAPVLERLAAAEARLEMAATHTASVAELRDRVVVVETKSAMPVPLPVPPEPVDLSPVLERIAAAEARLNVLGDLRDRVVTVETKAAVSPAPDPLLSECRERLRVLETKAVPAVEIPENLLARIGALESRPVGVSAPETKPVDLAPVLERLSKLEMRLDLQPDETTPIKTALAEATKDIGAMRERIAVVEVRAPMPGPPGKDGRDGKDGHDGADGVGFDDLVIEQIDERTVAYKGVKGDRVKELGRFTSPAMIQRGVWLDGKAYERGDVVTWGGSQWHANEDTSTKPGEGTKAWTLVVKRGRDGKDGRDAASAPPVVTVGSVR